MSYDFADSPADAGLIYDLRQQVSKAEVAAKRSNADKAVLVKALEDIKRATIEGRVCDDVAWFDTITTLYEFCDHVLSAVGKPQP